MRSVLFLHPPAPLPGQSCSVKLGHRARVTVRSFPPASGVAGGVWEAGGHQGGGKGAALPRGAERSWEGVELRPDSVETRGPASAS